MTASEPKKVVIVGGGFGGVKVALELARKRDSGIKIVLISDKPHFEYHPALYKVATGYSPMEACIPLREIFAGKEVEVAEDSFGDIDPAEKIIVGKSGSRYSYDYAVLALGSETSYFDIPGLSEMSFGFKSIDEALRLKNHLHHVFSECQVLAPEGKICGTRIVIIGGGASGVELAGELAVYTRKLALRHNIDQSLVTIDLMEAAPRLLPGFPEEVSKQVKDRLRKLGINVFLNRAVVKEEVESVYFKDMEIRAKTVIWTAGVKPHCLYSNIDGLNFDQRGRVVVNNQLGVAGLDNIYIIGDAASTRFAGMAQTANHQAVYIAKAIGGKVNRQKVEPYEPHKPAAALPIGPGWAAVVFGPFKFYGRLGWWVRKLADFKYFASILPLKKAWTVFQNGKVLSESCPVCSEEAGKQDLLY